MVLIEGLPRVELSFSLSKIAPDSIKILSSEFYGDQFQVHSMHGWNSCARLVGKSEEKLSPSEHWTIFVESSPISEHSLRPGLHRLFVIHRAPVFAKSV